MNGIRRTCEGQFARREEIGVESGVGVTRDACLQCRLVECRLASGRDLGLLGYMQTSGNKSGAVKREAARLVRQLPATASWDDLMYEILVRQKIETGLADLRDGRKHDHATIRKEFDLA